MFDISEHVIECYAEGDHHEDVCHKRERDEKFQLANLAGYYQRNKDEQHVPQDTPMGYRWVVVVHQLKLQNILVNLMLY